MPIFIYSFSQFLNESSKKLNDLDSYEQLKQRASRMGYTIISINYIGYTSSNALQDMQDDAIQSRTQMRLNTEIDKLGNELTNLKLQGQTKRFNLENDLVRAKDVFDQKVADLKSKLKIETDGLNHEFNLNVKDLEKNSLSQIDTEKLKIEEVYLEDLKNLGVDIDRYQSELNRSKNKIDTVYKLINK